MKKVCFLLALLLLLSGCAEGPQTDPVSTGTPGTSGTEVLGETIPEVIDYHQTVLDMMAAMPEIKPYDGEKRIPYDPDRKVFISLMNQDCDFWATGSMVGFSFHIFTLEPYDVSDIQVSFDMQTEYFTDVMDLNEQPYKKQMPYHCYAVSYGLDLYEEKMRGLYWSFASELASEYEEKLKDLRNHYAAAGKKWEEMEDYQLLEKHVDGFRKLYEGREEHEQKIQDAFATMEMPTFYHYAVAVYFPEVGTHEETVETATVTIGDEVYPVSFGQWRLHKDYPQEIQDAMAPPGLRGMGSMGGINYPHADGYGTVFYDFNVDEPVTLLGIRQMETQVAPFSVKGAQVLLYEKKDGMNVLKMDYFWDGHQPLNLEAGEIVRVQVLIQDDRLYQDFICTTPVFFLDYELRNREYSLVTHGALRLDDCNGYYLWDVYYRYFEEEDLGEYHYYFQPREWYDDMPAEWLE